MKTIWVCCSSKFFMILELNLVYLRNDLRVLWVRHRGYEDLSGRLVKTLRKSIRSSFRVSPLHMDIASMRLLGKANLILDMIYRRFRPWKCSHVSMSACCAALTCFLHRFQQLPACPDPACPNRAACQSGFVYWDFFDYNINTDIQSVYGGRPKRQFWSRKVHEEDLNCMNYRIHEPIMRTSIVVKRRIIRRDRYRYTPVWSGNFIIPY